MPPPSGSASSDNPAGPAASDMVLMTVTLSAGTLAEAAKQLGIPELAIDQNFGVVAVDPDRNLFAVRIPHSVVPAALSGGRFHGPFADPAIAPIPEPSKKP